MTYEDMFTDYEKLRYEAGWDGFKFGNYGPMYDYINKKLGVLDAEYFSKQNKRWKKSFCARIVYLYHPDREKGKKAEKYYKNHKGDITE